MIERDPFYFKIFCITFWAISAATFFFEECIPSVGEKLRLPLLMLCDVVYLFLGLVTLRNKGDKLFILSFFVIAIASSVINRVPALMWINGLRDYITFLFGLVILRYFFNSPDANRFRESFDKQLKIFLILQAFCVTEQFIRYGANDHGGGSLGNNSSGIISPMIILISFYLVSKNWDGDNYLKSLWRNRLYIFLMFPVFLNETKISLVLLAIYFALLFPFNIKSFGKVFVALPFMALVALGMYFAYVGATNDDNMEIDSMEFFDKYLTGGDETEDILDLADLSREFIENDYDDIFYVDLPRALKVMMMPDAMAETRGGLFLGAGAGHLKGGNTLEQTQFAIDNESLIFGTRTLLHLFFLPFGIIGLIWLFLWCKRFIAFKKRECPNAFQIKLFITIYLIICLLYNDALRYPTPCVIIYYLCLTSSVKNITKKHELIPKTVNNSSYL